MHQNFILKLFELFRHIPIYSDVWTGEPLAPLPPPLPSQIFYRSVIYYRQPKISSHSGITEFMQVHDVLLVHDRNLYFWFWSNTETQIVWYVLLADTVTDTETTF